MPPRAVTVALAGGLAALPAWPSAQGDPSGPPTFTFSAGPFERAFALADPAAPRAGLAANDLPPTDAAGREASACWQTWASAVSSAAKGEDATRARVWLAAFARLQERSDDAWEHLAHAGGDPQRMLAVLPLLFPGVAPERLGDWPALEDGALLAPALPPPAGPAAEIVLGTGRVREGSARVEGLRVGAARVALELRVEGDGVELELAHLAGGPARLRVLLPEPPDFELRAEYLDWEPLEGAHRQREIALAPGSEPLVLFGRYVPRRVEWSTRVPPALPAQAERDGLLVLAAETSTVEGLAAGLRQLLGLPVQVCVAAAGDPPVQFSGLVLDLRDPRALGAKRAGLVSLAERFALSPPR